MKKYITLIFAVSVLLTGCKKESQVTENQKASEVEKHEEPNVAHFTDEQIRTVGIQMGSIESKELSNTIKVSGMLTVPNQNKAFVTPSYSGIVRSLYVQPGSYVSKGKVIATISNPDLIVMQQQLQQVNGQIRMAELEVTRAQQLYKGNAAPLKKLQQAQTDLATLRSQRSGLQKQLGSIGATQSYGSALSVRAPISGTVSKVIAQIGSNVDMASPIAEIVSNSALHLDIYVYEKDLAKVQPGQTIHFTLTTSPGKEYDAKITSIGTAFEGESKTVPVHAQVVGDRTGLIDGMSVTVVISLDNQTAASVPTDAIVNDKGQDFIFIRQNDKNKGDRGNVPDSGEASNNKESEEKEVRFEKIPVAKGVTDLGYTQITPLKPIPDNAKVVVKNAFFILAKMNNKGEEGHGH
ncbi:efflux RND transporter periplasmic adaptor subunit [Chryseobacterium salipaludis]|uniref:efflux RND transporter periplasmic adaptor subunit n=1 Tax=Chryseobacterium TaxID=59732 RepID=UPI001FF68EFC|nr:MULTISPECIES: efflux RND transporter periplasmic adaptor subunit [Chryseobacterium]MCJ8498779.1 efflux RND transporter periplasmic adaptor subunit [Chryseobacterium salipaludis]MCX3297347.1 efflux RND transporter periplasmic adaptor subunit [Planobacterium sp. JC490]